MHLDHRNSAISIWQEERTLKKKKNTTDRSPTIRFNEILCRKGENNCLFFQLVSDLKSFMEGAGLTGDQRHCK